MINKAENPALIEIDGSAGEGGGQMLRTALGLSIVSGKPFRMVKIRAKRSKPGLLRQHLCCVQAAREIGAAQVDGAVLGSTELQFWPTANLPGQYRFAVGTAGSAALVLQAILPALLTAAGPSVVQLEGGTHNPAAPTFDFLARAFAPLINRLGAGLQLSLQRRGFFPAGGGRLLVKVQPAKSWQRLELDGNSAPHRMQATALISALDREIASRELHALRKRISGLSPASCEIVEEAEPRGPGNALLLELQGSELTEVFSAIGERGVSSEQVAERVSTDLRDYLKSGAAVGECLGDQLMLPMALGAGGSYTVSRVSEHARSNAAVIERFLAVSIRFDQQAPCWRVCVDRVGVC